MESFSSSSSSCSLAPPPVFSLRLPSALFSSLLAMRLLPRSSLLNGHRLLFTVVVSVALLAPAVVVASRGDRLPEFRDCLQVEPPPSYLVQFLPLIYPPPPRAFIHHPHHTDQTRPELSRAILLNLPRPPPSPPPLFPLDLLLRMRLCLPTLCNRRARRSRPQN